MYDFEVWRRIIVPANITFKQFHFVIQSSFNWLTYHMYDFKIFDNSDEGKLIAMVTDNKDEYIDGEIKQYPENTPLTAFLPEYRRVLYSYDYGDGWEHRCELEKVIDDYSMIILCVRTEKVTHRRTMWAEKAVMPILWRLSAT